MGALLYIYDRNKISDMRDALSDRRFISLSYLLHICDNIDDLENLDYTSRSNLVIDISNLIKEGNLNSIYIERYLLTILSEFENTIFCIRSEYFNSLVDIYPYLFDDDKISLEFREAEQIQNEIIGKSLKIISSLKLFVYRMKSTFRQLSDDNKIVSLLNLVDEFDGVSLKYNPKIIRDATEDSNVDFVDISSIIPLLKIRKDLISYFEVLLYHIATNEKVSFSITDEFSEEALQYFPLVFNELEYIESETVNASTISDNDKVINIEEINLISRQINRKLQGHKTFKDDFSHNLLKFTFLSTLSKRKILSIFLCGDSGIGKTEFAKIASTIMFPSEQLIKINFGNYSTEGVLNSLIGSPLGYAGSEEGGELINKIKTSKSRIILIDEFEKATPSVFNFFYELLEDGKFTDRHGVEHDLSGYIIVFTSNMSQITYRDMIPDPLKSRFDMVYNFTDLAEEDKITYIISTASNLVDKLKEEFGILVDINSIQSSLNELARYKNLRDIKRKIEDIVFVTFFDLYNGN